MSSAAALLIKPPPAVRAVLPKTAAFVSKNGRSFEHRIRNSAKGRTAKFAFLHESSPFHAYYEERVQFYKDGGVEEDDEKKENDDKKQGDDNKKKDGGDDKEGKENEAAAESAATEGKSSAEDAEGRSAAAKAGAKARASVPDPVARALLAARSIISDQERARQTALAALSKAKKEADDDNGNDKKPSAASATELAKMEGEVPALRPPPPLMYATLAAPTNLGPSQIEVIKLTAQYAALSSLADTGSNSSKGGRPNFVKTLTEREWSNDAGVLGFLQPRDGAFAYFTALVDAYRTLLGTDGGGAGTGGAGTGGGGGGGGAKKGGDGTGDKKGDELLAELAAALTATGTTADNNNFLR